MTTHEIVVAVAEWVVGSCDPTIQGSYPYLPAQKEQQLPDVVVEIGERRLTTEDPLFPFWQIQQKWLNVWRAEFSIMVDNADPAAAAEQLENYTDQLEAALRQDGSLGGRVPFASPYLTFDLTAPFVEYADGTRGREMNVTVHIGELVEAPE